MDKRILAVATLTLAVILALIQRAGAAVTYTNSLTNIDLVSSNFTSFTTVDSDYINNPPGGWFVIDTNYGLELLSTNPNYVDGLATYNRLLQASNDWTITIQPHISAITNNQTNPYYSAGISLIQTTTKGLIYPNRVDLNLVRTGVTGANQSNTIISSLYVNNGETDTVSNKNLTNVYLQFRYTAASKSLVSAYSTNGSNFTTIQSYNLVTGWKIKATDQLTLGVAANDQPDGRETPNYNLLPGIIYLNNLTVVSPNASTNVPTNNTTAGTLGGTLSLGTGGSQNVYSGGVAISNGAIIFNGGTLMGGSGSISIMGVGSLTDGNLQLTNPNSGSSSNSTTNVLGGGGVTNGGNIGIINSNFCGVGALTNTNSINLGGGNLQIGTGTVILNTNSMISGSSNSAGNTNILGGGGGVGDEGNNMFTITNSIGVGSLTNTNSIGGGLVTNPTAPLN